jgi:hypothetical protein
MAIHFIIVKSRYGVMELYCIKLLQTQSNTNPNSPIPTLAQRKKRINT